MDDSVVFSQDDLHKTAFPAIADIRRQGLLCDVTLKAGDQKFSAHRIILAATIPYFHAMFTHDMLETKKTEITMESIEPSALESLINFAYSGRLVIDINNVQCLLIVASFLNMQAVKDACCAFLKKRLEPSSCLSVRAFADQYMCSTLVEAANNFIQKNFKSVISSQDFLALSNEEVLDLLSRDEINVANEEQVFEAALKWIKQKEATRKHLLPKLLVQVRLPLLTPQYLTDKVATEELIKSSLKCRDLLDEARNYHLMPERRLLLQTFKTRPRCCPDAPGFIYAVGGLTSAGDSLSTVERYDPVTGKWFTGESMTTMRSRVGVTVLKGCIYAIGGYNGMERLDTVEVYEPLSRRWKIVAPMNCKRSALGAVSLNDRIVVCGGYDGVTSLRSCELYDPRTNAWELLNPMNKHRSAAGVAILNGEVISCGGHDGLSIFDSVEAYNPSKGEWRMLPPMKSKRCRLGVISLKGKLYAVGGYDGRFFLKTVECYDPVTETWEIIAPMKMMRSRVAVAATFGKLFAIGGYDGQANLKSIEIHDPNTGEWTMGSDMSAHEGGVGVGIVAMESVLESDIASLNNRMKLAM